MGDNIRRAILLAHAARTRRIPACFLSLDIWKAFDSLSCSYLNSILRHWSFGTHFLRWIAALYHHSKAYLSYSGYCSGAFTIERGTRQGCPLSPAFFALSIKSLGQLIRSNQNVKGLELGDYHHKICTFAGGVLIFLTSPLLSSPTLVDILSKFGQISGLTINPQKSKALNISIPSVLQTQLHESLPFAWSTTHISYLDINFTAHPKDLYAMNYPPLLTQTSKFLTSWSSLPLAWMGRITVIKMSILHKILYLFIVLPKPFLHIFYAFYKAKPYNLFGTNSDYIYLNQPYIPPRIRGGLGVPDFTKYYYAAQFTTTPQIPCY